MTRARFDWIVGSFIQSSHAGFVALTDLDVDDRCSLLPEAIEKLPDTDPPIDFVQNLVNDNVNWEFIGGAPLSLALNSLKSLRDKDSTDAVKFIAHLLDTRSDTSLPFRAYQADLDITTLLAVAAAWCAQNN